MAAGHVSAQFNLELAKLCGGRPDLLEKLAAACPHFDCRLGDWESWAEAKALLVWWVFVFPNLPGTATLPTLLIHLPSFPRRADHRTRLPPAMSCRVSWAGML